MDDNNSESSVLRTNLLEWKLNLSRPSVDMKSRHHQTMSVTQDPETRPTHESISASMLDKLAYYRAYVSTTDGLEAAVMQQNNVLAFVWNYLASVFRRSLPVTYVHLFLSQYAPDYHFFVGKIAPISHGSTFVFIGTAILRIYLMAVNLTLYMTYVFDGLYNLSPWNRCPKNETLIALGYDHCYQAHEVSKIFMSPDNRTFQKPFFVSSTGKRFQLAQVIYFHSSIWNVVSHKLVFALMALAAAHYNQLYNSYVWKVLQRVQIAQIIFYVIIFTHLLHTFKIGEVRPISSSRRAHQMPVNIDVYFLSESLSSPPIYHFFNSKSANEGSPGLCATVIVISNATYYLFKGVLSYLLKNHCQNVVGAPLKKTAFSKLSIFYFWTIYFNCFYPGDIYALLFFSLHTIVDFYVLVITFHSLAETLAKEWYYMSKIVAVVFIFVTAIIVDTFTSTGQGMLITFLTWSGVSTALEGLAVFWMYPVTRLMDDVYFHNGIPLRTLRKLVLATVPIHYTLKVYTLIIQLSDMCHNEAFRDDLSYVRIAMIYILTLLGIGVVYSVIQVIRKKQGFCQLFKPIPEWGPPDFQTRQLRKEFDSRMYIESQGLRQLSRHLLRRAEGKVYKVDVTYDAPGAAEAEREKRSD